MSLPTAADMASEGKDFWRAHENEDFDKELKKWEDFDKELENDTVEDS